ncbi:Fanconi-associated nuclease 1-like protein [Chloropicon primus]|uniref:Fanconi-associated nuclease n=2 Tax=Chloropicon primus TaxID=1764295 RepID=A0A5B8MRJ3_9CHLO|nr:Fanconi-associated nuclease 1-like protein [Chloropicon primus]UPR02310.1 Fanconi-associated nuclease 1-like protein [Chloropicon primus]|eukprot:QDZ23096.1 Fanconi-associated nuclease 1-like protein [Chloropicon primus]
MKQTTLVFGPSVAQERTVSVSGSSAKKRRRKEEETEEDAKDAKEDVWEEATFWSVVRTRRTQEAKMLCKIGTELVVSRDPTNEKDPEHAIKLVAESKTVGHLPALAAVHLSALLDGPSPPWVARATVIGGDSEGSVEPIQVRIRFKLEEESKDGAERRSFLESVLASASKGQAEQFKQKCEQLAGALDAVLDFCANRAAHLFHDCEVRLMRTVKALPLRPKALLVRLYMRKRQWFRVGLLSRYVEVGDIEAAVSTLHEHGLVSRLSDCVEDVSLESQLSLLSVKELQGLAGRCLVKDHKRMRRRDLVRALSAAGEGAQKIADCVKRCVGGCVEIAPDAIAVLNLVRFTYFLNDSQGLERFVLRHQGICNYPSYAVSVSGSVFRTREELIEYQSACEAESRLQAALEANNLKTARKLLSHSCAKLGFHLDDEDWGTTTKQKLSRVSGNPELPKGSGEPSLLQSFRASWVHVGIAHQGIALLEKKRRYSDAIELIQVLLGRPERPSKRGDWWVRFTVDLEHLGQKETSLEVAESALADKWVRVGQRLSLQRRILRLGKPPRRWKKPAFAERASWKPRERKFVGRPTNRERSVRSNFVGFDDENVTVEQLALQYYSQEDHGSWRGLHSENGIWGTLFALLMWDVLFSDVPDVFQHPFQAAPLDLDSDFFYSQRKELIDARLREISEGNAPCLIQAVWSRESERRTLCVGLTWGKYQLDQLVTIVQCIGGAGLAIIMRLLAEDHKHWRSGMPDLVLWRTTPSPSALLSEVKGPRDTLADKQRAWLAELSFGGVDVEVCKILEKDM